MLPRLITLFLFRAESAKTVACGRIKPRRLRVPVPPSDSLELVDWVEIEETDDVPETDLSGSSNGTAPRAREGDVLGEGERARSEGGDGMSEAMLVRPLVTVL